LGRRSLHPVKPRSDVYWRDKGDCTIDYISAYQVLLARHIQNKSLAAYNHSRDQKASNAGSIIQVLI
jgi:hypothetical protein